MHQTIANACGTIGILHALANAPGIDRAAHFGGFIGKFLESAAPLNPMQRADLLEKDDDVEKAQGVAAAMGQTEVQPIETNINLHFIAMVPHAGQLWELDGRKPFPLPIGRCDGPVDGSQEGSVNVLQASAAAVKKLMALNPDEINFSLAALVKQ